MNNINTDIKFSTNRIELDSNNVEVKGHTLILKKDDRCTDDNEHRRALFHAPNDILVINHNGDYPGGVAVGGIEVTVVHHLRVRGPSLRVDNETRRQSSDGLRRALVHGVKDNLVINYGGDYPGGVRIVGQVRVPDDLLVDDMNVGQLLTEYKNRIEALEDRIAKLESQS